MISPMFSISKRKDFKAFTGIYSFKTIIYFLLTNAIDNIVNKLITCCFQYLKTNHLVMTTKIVIQYSGDVGQVFQRNPSQTVFDHFFTIVFLRCKLANFQ